MSFEESATVQSMEEFAEASKEQSNSKTPRNQRTPQDKVNYGNYGQSVETVENLLNEHAIEFEPKHKQGETIFELVKCPESDQHHRKAWVKIDKDGNVTAGCQKERCKWGFPSFHKKIVGEYPKSPKQHIELSAEAEELAEMPGLHWTTTKQGKDLLVANLHNVETYLTNKNLPIWYDSFLRKIKYEDLDTGEVGNWEDKQTLKLTKHLQQYEGLRRIGRDIVDQGASLYAFSK